MEKWIWLDDKIYPEYQTGKKTFFDTEKTNFCVATFVKDFSLKKNADVVIKIVADTRYLLKVDGEILARVQGYSGGDYAYTGGGVTAEYDAFHLTLSAGSHEIKADVLACPQMTNEISLGRGGLCAEVSVRYDDGEEYFTTDESWIAYPNPAYPSAWNYAPTLDRGQNTPAVLTDAKRTVVQRRSPLPKNMPVKILSIDGNTTVNTEEIVLQGKGSMRLDFGRIYCLFADFEVIAKGHGRVQFNFAEVDKTYLQYAEVLHTEQGMGLFAPFHYHNARYLDIEYDCEKTITLLPRLKECCYPMTERGCFSCDDEGLNKIYETCLSSVRLCLKEQHLDSPVHQEPLGTIGDYKIDSLVEYNAFGLYELTKADIIRTAEHLDKTEGYFFHTTYTLIWVDWIREYLLYTDDLDTVKQVLPTLKTVFDRFVGYIDEDGLVANCPTFMFIDWVDIDGHSLHHPPKVLGQGPVSCFTYQAFMSYAEILSAVGDETGALQVKAQASRLKAAINEKLWKEDKGLYLEGLPERDASICGGFRPYGEGEYYGVYTNTLAVAFGIAEHGYEIMEKLATDTSFVRPQFYFNHFYLNALLKVGLFEKYGFDIFDSYREAVEKCPSGLAECRIDAGTVEGLSNEMTPGYQYDFSHGWGATPAYHCFSAVLGVKPTANGFVDYTVDPCLGRLNWAKGCVPTLDGVIEVSVRRMDGKVVKEVRRIVKEK